MQFEQKSEINYELEAVFVQFSDSQMSLVQLSSLHHCHHH